MLWLCIMYRVWEGQWKWWLCVECVYTCSIGLSVYQSAIPWTFSLQYTWRKKQNIGFYYRLKNKLIFQSESDWNIKQELIKVSYLSVTFCQSWAYQSYILHPPEWYIYVGLHQQRWDVLHVHCNPRPHTRTSRDEGSNQATMSGCCMIRNWSWSLTDGLHSIYSISQCTCMTPP